MGLTACYKESFTYILCKYLRAVIMMNMVFWVETSFISYSAGVSENGDNMFSRKAGL
jgi:hypothetical protein